MRGETRYTWTLFGICGVARPAQMFFATIPPAILVALHVLPALAFAWSHAAGKVQHFRQNYPVDYPVSLAGAALASPPFKKRFKKCGPSDTLECMPAARYTGWLWVLLAIYAAARVAQRFADTIPPVLLVAPALLFALLHGAIAYRVRGILLFAGLCLAIGNILENLSIFTGFPFGHYHFTGVMGPKVLQVPVLLGLAYVGIGYISWTVARVILGDAGEALSGARLFTRPVAAAFVMVAWDFSQEAVWSNLVHGWRWHDGGAFFGVPLSNYFGWYFTVYLIYQAFALLVNGKSPILPKRFWLTAVIFYGVCGFGNLFVPAPPGTPVIFDVVGTQWPVTGVLGTSSLISMFVMGAFFAIAWIRLADGDSAEWD